MKATTQVRKGCCYLLLGMALGLYACIPQPSGLASSVKTFTGTPAPSPTATMVWFPPTPTRTAIPTQVLFPTPDQRPGLGDLLLEDPFTSQGAWLTIQNSIGSIAYGQQELTVAISKPKGYLATLRNSPELDDFYLEITASPNLCRTKDSYGLLLRAAGLQDGYRLALSCDGQVRLERLKNGEIALLQDWTPSGQIPPGSPLSLRLGVWAFNRELRVFINDEFQFSAQDPVWSSGKVGVFARSAGDDALTVNFSDLVVRSVFAVPTLATPSLEQLTATQQVLSTATPCG